MSVFDWCYSGQHDRCHRKYERTYSEVRRGKTIIVHTDDWVHCECKKRGCKCYVKPADRVKKKAKPRKRKK